MPVLPLGTILMTPGDDEGRIVLIEHKRGKADSTVMFPGNCPFVIVSYLPRERYLLAPLAVLPKAASFFEVGHDAPMTVIDSSTLKVDPEVYQHLTGSELPNASMV